MMIGVREGWREIAFGDSEGGGVCGVWGVVKIMNIKMDYLTQQQMNKHFKLSYSSSKHNSNSLDRLRSTVLKIEQTANDFELLRNSYSTHRLRTNNLTESTELRGTEFGLRKKKSFESLKNTLDILQTKVNMAKQELQLPVSMKKNKNRVYFHQQKNNRSQDSTHRPTDSSITKKNAQIYPYVTQISKPKNLKTLSLNPYSPRRHSVYYISEVVRSINQKNSLALEHVNSSIKMMKACQAYDIPHLGEVEDRKITLKKSEYYRDKKTLILDLDETLVHCNENVKNQADMKLQIKIDGNLINISINIRPYALTFLKKMTSKYEIIVFTASHKTYANAILDELDPDGEIFQHRLFREHCYPLGHDLYIKDLRILNRNLSSVVLVDNAAYSYAFQLQNGIPILPFYEGADYELAALEGYLNELEKESDVRELNKKTFKLHHYSKFFNGEELIDQLYMNNFH